MDSIITSIGTVFTAAMGWMGEVSTAVVSNPLLLIGVVTGFIFLGVGLFKRLLRA